MKRVIVLIREYILFTLSTRTIIKSNVTFRFKNLNFMKTVKSPTTLELETASSSKNDSKHAHFYEKKKCILGHIQAVKQSHYLDIES